MGFKVLPLSSVGSYFCQLWDIAAVNYVTALVCLKELSLLMVCQYACDQVMQMHFNLT